jgi:hypothetical protein
MFGGDTTPDAFSFGTITKALNASTVSKPIIITGINAPAPVSISGGIGASYSKNGGAFTTSPGTVVNGDVVQVTTNAPSTNSSSTTVTLTVGGTSGTYVVTATSSAIDQTPTGTPSFGSAVTSAAQNTYVASASSYTVAGLGSSHGAAFAFAGDSGFQIQVNSGGWIDASKVLTGYFDVKNGDVLQLRAFTGGPGTQRTVSGTIGSTQYTTWTCTTANGGSNVGTGVSWANITKIVSGASAPGTTATADNGPGTALAGMTNLVSINVSVPSGSFSNGTVYVYRNGYQVGSFSSAGTSATFNAGAGDVLYFVATCQSDRAGTPPDDTFVAGIVNGTITVKNVTNSNAVLGTCSVDVEVNGF